MTKMGYMEFEKWPKQSPNKMVRTPDKGNFYFD